GEGGELCGPRVHAPDVAAEGYLPAAPVVRIIEIVVSLRVGAEFWVVDVRRQRQGGAAAPAAHELRGQQLAFFLGAAIRPEESIERTDTRLIFPESHIGAIPAEYAPLLHRHPSPPPP